MSIDSSNISNELVYIEQHSSIELQEYPNITLNVSNSINPVVNNISSTEIDVLSISIKKIHSKRKSYIATFSSVLFTIIIITIAVLIICLTIPKTDKSCQVFIQTVIDNTLSQHDSKPTSVVAADLNHDKMIDIIVVNSGTNTIGIFLNYDDGSFVLQILLKTGDFSRPISIAVGDFNNDTHLDIAVANFNTHNIGIFLGYGDGNFSNQTTFSTDVSRPISIAVGDLNNDYYLDIVIANNGTNNIGIFIGYGNGSFGNYTTYSTGYDSFPYSIALADFNHDQNLDIVVTNYGTNNIGIFIGYGNGYFKRQIIYSTGLKSNPYSIAINDLNNDGHLDIAVANSGTNNVGIFFGNGNGSFESQITYPISPGSSPQSIVITDFDQDNQLDIAVSNYHTNNLSILIGYGNGTFEIPTMHSTGIDSSPFGITVGDFDNNNQSDIAIANLNANNILILIGYNIIQSKNPTVYTTGTGSRPYQIASGDFNNDTHIDLVIVNSGTNTIGVFIGYGNGSFQQQKTYSTGNNSQPQAVAISDLDNDHQLDIIVGNYRSESLGILYGYNSGTFDTVVLYFTEESSALVYVIIDDFNNDNHQDIVFADYGTNSIGILLGNGNRTFKNLRKFSSGNNSRPSSIASGDFNNDDQLDIAVVNYLTNDISIFRGFGNGTFTLLAIYLLDDRTLPQMITVIDVDKDNYLDIIITETAFSIVGIFYGFGNGSFETESTYSTGSVSLPYWISVADFNNDNLLDLAVANLQSDNIGILLQDSSGYFSDPSFYSTGSHSSPISIAVGDFNKDNQLDIAVANYGTNNVAILLGHPSEDLTSQIDNMTDIDLQSSSTITNDITNVMPILLGDYYADFDSQITYSTGSSSHPYSIAVGDLNSDKQMDILVANSGNKNISLLVGYTNEFFHLEIIHLIDISSNPQHIIINDFNNDNRLDIAVTTPIDDSILVLLGNGDGTFSTKLTYSTGSGSYPTMLAIDNFNNDKYLDLVVTNKKTNTIGIFFGFDYTVFERQKPPQNDSNYAPYFVTSSDLNNDGYLDIVTAFYGSNNVGIFLGYGNGTFAPVMICAYVPLSYPYAVAVGDFNNDNILDITVANWGIDSISVVLGYGDGTFAEPILYSTGSNTRPSSVAVGDFDNDNCLDIITANYGTNSISVFFGYGNGTFQDVITLSTGENSGPRLVIVSDVNNDTQLDIIVVNEVTDNVGIFIGYGNGSFAAQITFSSGTKSAPWYAIAHDLNNDGQLDLAIANHGIGNVGILYGYGNGSFGNLQIYSTNMDFSPAKINVGDFNNDNKPDIIISSSPYGNVGVLFGYGNGTFASMLTIPTEKNSIAFSITIGDFNNDNNMDFIIADVGFNNIGVFLANGSIPFGGQTTFFIGEGSHPTSLTIDHFNNDNYLDIAVTNSDTNNISILFGNGNRMFSNITTYSTGYNSHPLSIAKGDFNNDSLIDIVIANSKTDNIIVLLSYGNGSFSNLMSYSMGTGSQPVSIAVGDFNRDYQLDIVVANYGTNNLCILFGYGNGTFTNQTWHALDYDARPNWIIFKDLNNDDWEDIVVATYGIDNIKVLWNIC